MRMLLALLFGTTMLLAAPVPKEKKKIDDAEAIIGTWKIETFDSGGGQGDPSKTELDAMRFVFGKDNKFNVNSGKAFEMKGTFKIDSASEVKTIDLVMTEPNDHTSKGIYELDGDTLKICMADRPASPRPTEFKPEARNHVAVVTFKRVVEEKKDK